MTARADLGTLEASGLVQVASLEPDLEYLFRHALVQDAAYGSLLRQDRRDLHRLAAESLLALYPARRRELAGVIAMHLERAGDAAAAAEHLAVAGEHALERFANREAIAFFARAEALLAADDPRIDLRLRLAIGAAKGGWTFAGVDAPIARLEATIAAGEDRADRHLLADAYFWIVFLRRLRGETIETTAGLRRALDRVGEIGESLGDPVARAMPQAFMGVGLIFTGDLRAGAEMADKALEAIEGQADPFSSAILSGIITIAYARLGEFALADRSLERSERLAERGDPIARLDTLIAKGAIAVERGDLAAGGALATDCARRSEELGATACGVGSNVLMGSVRLALDDATGAMAPLARGQELAIVANMPPWRTLAEGLLGAAKTWLGDVPGGAAGWTAALESARGMHDRYGEATVLWGRGRARAAQPGPDQPAALADLDAAAALLEAIGARPALARVQRDRAKALRSLGREADAAAADRAWRDLAVTLGLRDARPPEGP